MPCNAILLMGYDESEYYFFMFRIYRKGDFTNVLINMVVDKKCLLYSDVCIYYCK